MAWNQPGGNGGKDPWGGGSNQGPPDLDEVLRKLQAKLASIFGGRGGGPRVVGGGGGGGFPRGGGVFIGVLLLVVVVAWGLFGMYVVQQGERAVVQRFGKYARTVGPGLHWVPTGIERFDRVNVDVVRSQEIGFRLQGTTTSGVPNEALMLTSDENIIDIQFAVQYNVKDAANFLFRVVDPEITLRQVTESAVREVVGRSTMDFVITEGRGAVAVEVETLIQQTLDSYETGLFVRSVNMQEAKPPSQVQEAFFDAIKAREDQERIINEANAYQNEVVPKARGEAQAVRQRAQGYRQSVMAQADGETARFLEVLAEYLRAPQVTRDRLYLEAMESVLSNTSKVLVDVEGGNNIMYLPLDRIMNQRVRPAPALPGGIDSSPRQESPRSGFESSRRSRDGGNGRDR